MPRWIATVERAERVFLMLMVLGSILLSVVGVFYRYFLNSSLSFVEELAGFILAGIIVVGSSMAISAKEHIRVEVLPQLVPATRRWLDRLAWLSLLVLSLMMVVLTSRFVLKLLTTNQMSTSMEFLPVGWPLVVLPVGYLLCALKSAALLLGDFVSPRAAAAEGPAFAAPPTPGAPT
jgi:TRAP-type C4-dicarboxylate transport system permease small subunit